MSFLSTFMRTAFRITGAEQAIAFDTDLEIVDTTEETKEIESFVLEAVQDAITNHALVITDNYSLSIDPSQVPHTNQVLPALRTIIVIPVAGHGAIYLAQLIRNGIIPRSMVEKLFRLADHLIEEGQTDTVEDELLGIYSGFD